MTAIKFSIVIPTRDRAEYLASCLASVVKSAELSGAEVEIVVSDNASTDNTESTVKAATYPGIKYIRRPERLSMRQNFEEALGDTTGSHVIFIGDDDAVLPNGLKALGDFIRTTGADAVNWPVLNFLWPDPKFDAPRSLKIAPYKLSGRNHKVDVAAAYGKILDGTYRSYHSGIVSYHGCVSREVIDAGRESCQGTYFWCSSPDVFSSIRNLMTACFIFARYPKILFTLSRCPILGAARNPDSVITPVITSNRPIDTTHCRDPINDW